MAQTTVGLDLIGFGSVGKALLPLLHRCVEATGRKLVVTGIRTRSGLSVATRDVEHPIELSPGDLSLPERSEWPEAWTTIESVEEMLAVSPGAVVVENSVLDFETGEPAASYIRAAFAAGKHVVTSNKGPVATQYKELAAAAKQAGVGFRFESVVKLGEYILTVEADGYAPQHRRVKVGPKIKPQEFLLRALNPIY